MRSYHHSQIGMSDCLAVRRCSNAGCTQKALANVCLHHLQVEYPLVYVLEIFIKVFGQRGQVSRLNGRALCLIDR